jgi:expansin
MDRDLRASHRKHLLRSIVRLAGAGLVSIGAASWLSACQSPVEPGTTCTSATDCASAQQCIGGQCVTPGAGGGGTATSGAGTSAGGSAASNPGTSGGPSGSGATSSSAGPSTGGQSTGGQNSGDAGQSVGGSSGARTGSGGTTSGAGGAGKGGSAGKGGGTSTGGAGAGGLVGADVVGKCKDDYLPAANNGSVTRYDFSQGTSLPACTYVITHKGAGRDGDWDTVEGISTGDGGYFGAMNTSDYNGGATCGACVELTFSGKKIVITIVDECPVGSNPKCVKGHIDLSRKAIRQLQPDATKEDLSGVSWRYVTCPATGNAKMRLHPNQTADWQPVVVENGLYPLSKVTINGVSASRVGNNSGGNAWLATGQKLPYSVLATDVNGDALQANFSGGTTLTDVGKQFMCTK